MAKKSQAKGSKKTAAKKNTSTPSVKKATAKKKAAPKKKTTTKKAQDPVTITPEETPSKMTITPPKDQSDTTHVLASQDDDGKIVGKEVNKEEFEKTVQDAKVLYDSEDPVTGTNEVITTADVEESNLKQNDIAKATIPPEPKETEVSADNIDDIIANAKEITSETVAQTTPQPVINDPNFQTPAKVVSESELANYAGVFLSAIEGTFRYKRGLMTIAELEQDLATPNYPFTYRIERNKEKPIEVCVYLSSGDVEKRVPSLGWLTINS